MVAFIVVPKNRGLMKYRELALQQLDISEPELIEVRGEDVPFWLSQLKKKGKRAIGLTGEDLYREYCLEERECRLDVIRRIAWDDSDAYFRKPAVCLMGPKGRDLDSFSGELTVCVAKKYKRIAKRYLNFLESKGYTFQKMYLNGSVESSFLMGLADLLIDIVYTGRSMKSFGLSVYDKILESDLLVIGQGDMDES